MTLKRWPGTKRMAKILSSDGEGSLTIFTGGIIELLSEPASFPIIKSMFGPFDTTRKIGRRVKEAKSVFLRPQEAVLEKPTAKNNYFSNGLNQGW